MADILGIETEIRNQLHLMDAEGTCKERPAEIDIERYLKRRGYTGYGYNIWHDDFQGFWRWSCNILKLKKRDMQITFEYLKEIAIAAYGNSPVRASIAIAEYSYNDYGYTGYSCLNYAGSDKAIFGINLNAERTEVDIYTDNHGINCLAVIRKMEELGLIEKA